MPLIRIVFIVWNIYYGFFIHFNYAQNNFNYQGLPQFQNNIHSAIQIFFTNYSQNGHQDEFSHKHSGDDTFHSHSQNHIPLVIDSTDSSVSLSVQNLVLFYAELHRCAYIGQRYQSCSLSPLLKPPMVS